MHPILFGYSLSSYLPIFGWNISGKQLRQMLCILSNCIFKLFYSKTKSSSTRKIWRFKLLQLTSIYFSHTFTVEMLPYLLCWTPISIGSISAFGTVRFSSFLHPLEYIPFPVIINNMVTLMTVCQLPCGNIFKNSNKLYKNVKGEVLFATRSKYLRKKVKSLKPFGIRISPVPRLKKLAFLHCCSMMTNTVFTMLITFPQHVVKQ